MANVKVSSDIGAPVDVVFGCFTDIQQAPQNVSGIKQIELLTPGGFSLGTRWRETREVLGRNDDAEMEVTSFEKNHSYTITHQKGGVRITATFLFEPIPNASTRVSIEFALHASGLPPGLLAPVEWAVSGKVREVLTADLEDLRSAVGTIAAQWSYS
ncbi:MAG: SRPBCC family protein [Gammaproteobacteria bacterium]